MIVEWDPLMPRIVHDVRALVRKGMVPANLLENKLGTGADPEIAVWLKSITSSYSDLNLLMLRLGTLANAAKARSGGREEWIDLDASLLGAKLRCRPMLEQSAAAFSIGLLPSCRVATQIEVVWTELITNSCCFRDPNRPLEIRIEATQDNNGLRVQFTDNGSGWNPAYAELLFQPLQRLDPQKGGFGLGLAIARATAESVGGQIDAEVGSPGACFQVQVPVAPPV